MVALSPHITQFEYKHKYRIFGAAAASVAVFTGAFLLIGEFAPVERTSAERINVNIGDGAYYMNITADDLDIDIDATPEGVTRTVQKDVKVSTNSGTGYKLYLSMNNNETNGNRLYYNGDKTNTNYIIPTSSSSLSTNSWGYSTDGSSFSAVPLQGNEAVIGQSATSPSSPVTHSVYYGFNVNNTLPFGSYSGVVTYTAVADAAASPTAHTSVANYLDDKSMADPAGGDTLVITTSLMTNMANIGDVTVSVGGTNCPVTATSTKNKYAEVSCTMPAKSAGSYAVAVTFAKFSKTYNTTITYDANLFGVGMNKIRTMQGMTTGVCNAIATPAAYQSDGTTINTDVPKGRLRDTRDANSYYVKKLADGNCWMDQNLNLDLGTTDATGSANTTWYLSSTDTDINYNNYKGSTSTSANRWYPGRNTQWNTSPYFNDADAEVARSFTFKDDEYTGGAHSGGTTGRYWNNGTSYSSTIGSYTERNHFGNYYNWYAATAGTGTVSAAQAYYNVGDSICPKGWQLPVGPYPTTNNTSPNKSYDHILHDILGFPYPSDGDYGSTAATIMKSDPYHMIFSGYIYNGFASQGANGHYYTSQGTNGGTGSVGGYSAHHYTGRPVQVYASAVGDLGMAVGMAVRCVNH